MSSLAFIIQSIKNLSNLCKCLEEELFTYLIGVIRCTYYCTCFQYGRTITHSDHCMDVYGKLQFKTSISGVERRPVVHSDEVNLVLTTYN